MPKSKRNKPVSLTKVSKKGLEFKQTLIKEIREYAEKFANIFIFHHQNLRNVQLKELRESWKPSKFLFCKNSLTSYALGKTPESACRQGIEKVGPLLKGQCGLLFTDKDPDDVLEFFNKFNHIDYARYKNKASQTIDLPKGQLNGVSHSFEKYLKNVGLPVFLEKGHVALTEDYTLCREDEILTIDQAKILKLLNIPLAETSITVTSVWSAVSGDVKILNEDF